MMDERTDKKIHENLRKSAADDTLTTPAKLNPRLNEAVSVLRSGVREMLTQPNEKRIEAGRTLISTRISADEVAAVEDFVYCLNMNSDKSNPYYAMAMINHPNDSERPVSVSTGSLTPNKTLIIGYAATAVEYAGNGIGRAVVNDLIDNARREAKERGWGDIDLVALEASKESPSFWGGKIGCRSIELIDNQGNSRPFKYIQPTFEWDYNTGLPVKGDLTASLDINLAGSKLAFPGVNEKFMVKSPSGKSVTSAMILNAVTDFLDNYYFTSERSDFSSDKAYENYLGCRNGLIEAYQSQFKDVREIKLS